VPDSVPARQQTEGGAQPGFSLLTEASFVLGISVLVVLPCFWQLHIQAGDLSSHLYNAWLASRIQSGEVQSFELAPVWTNVLSDWILADAVPALGVVWAERVVAVPAVLLFFWGAFYLLNVATGRKPWIFCPLLAIFTYGLVFHLGFLNFYISTGLSLWLMGMFWGPGPVRRRTLLLAVPVAALALLAHVLPLFWAAAVIAYLRSYAAVPKMWRPVAPGLALLALGALRALLERFPMRWSLDQIASLDGVASLTAAEQAWLFDEKYLLVAAGLLFVFLLLLLDRLDRPGLLSDACFQLWLLHCAAVAILPSAVQFPQYQHVLAYIPQRLSLFTGVAFLLMTRGLKPGRGAARSSGIVAVFFFLFLFIDHQAFNAVESGVTRVVRTAPADQRVVAVIHDKGARVNALAHVADRACIGHCFSYANYEPATGQFRIRLREGNRINAASVALAQEIERGDHVVAAFEDPLYAVCGCGAGSGDLCLRTLHAGDHVCAVSRQISLRLWNQTLRTAPIPKE
jgi:hypothetical protein